MLFSLAQHLFPARKSTAPLRQRSAGTTGIARGVRKPAGSIGLESLEPRIALTVLPANVPPPSVALTAASDTGVRGDGVTRLSRPTFTGRAPARSTVVVYTDALRTQPLGTVRANALGVWSLTTPAARPFTAGDYAITAYAINAANVSSGPSTRLSLRIDDSRPTASIVYDAVNGRATLTFSEPVSGVSLASLRLAGRTAAALSFANRSIADVRLYPLLGNVTLSASSDAKTFTFQEQFTLAEPGTFTLTLAPTGIVDRAGNLLAGAASTTFQIL